MQGKNSFHTDAVGDFTDGEGRADAAVDPLDANALEHLNPLFVPFNDLDVYPQGVPGRITSYNVCYTKLLREA